jgi:hypothetical protein
MKERYKLILHGKLVSKVKSMTTHSITALAHPNIALAM